MKEKKLSNELSEMTFYELLLEFELEINRCFSPIDNDFLDRIREELVIRYEDK